MLESNSDSTIQGTTLALFWVLVSLSWEPGLFGQNAAPALACISIICITLQLFQKHDIRNAILPIYLSLIPSLYSISKSAFFNTERLSDASKGLLLSTIAYSFAYIALTRISAKILCKYFVLVMAIISLSLIASYLIYGASLANCQPIFSFKIKHYGDATADVYFPFTIAYPQRYTLLSFTVIRGMGMFREPGVSQAFLNAALICCGLLWRGWSAHFRAAIIFLGIVLTMSTAGIINLMISIPLYAICVYGKKAIVPVFIATLFLMPAFAFITNMESVGLHDKLSGESGEDRLNAFAEFQRLWSDAGIWGLSGIGRYKTESTAGTLLIYYLNNGLIGLVASMAPIIYFLTKSHLGKALLVLVPPSISMLTSQPLWGTVPFVVLVALAQKLSLETTTSNSSSD